MGFGPEEEKTDENTTHAYETYGKWTFFISAASKSGGIPTYPKSNF